MQLDFVLVRISEKLANLAPSSSETFIFKVQKQLRSVNEKAYDPEIVAIGPYNHGKQNLEMMEELKLRYLEQLLQRKGEIDANKYILALRPLQLSARRCYAEQINFTTDEFVEMLLLDGCFVVEVIRKFGMEFLRNKNDPIFQKDWILISLQRDLMLFENQLPFFILCKLFDFIEDQYNHSKFIYLALHFFRGLLSGNGDRMNVNASSDLNVKHLLGLIHNNWIPLYDRMKVSVYPQTMMCWNFIPSATELLEAGVKIKEEEKDSLFDIKFKSGVIRIPPLRIEDRTETFLRNLVAYEQYYPDIQRSYVAEYVRFINCLINSSNDVEVLCYYGIIDNWLGDKEIVSDIFNKIGAGVAGSVMNSQYADMFGEVNAHYSKHRDKWLTKLWSDYFWYKWLAMLRTDYFYSPWASISVFVAFILLVLTFTQTFFAVFPRKA